MGNGKEDQEDGINVYIYTADSLYYTAGDNTTVESSSVQFSSAAQSCPLFVTP